MDDQRDERQDAAVVVDEAFTDEEPGRTLREDGPVRNFDPTPYLRQLRGRGGGSEYLDVKWRLLWLRTEHPDAEIVTEHVQLEPTLAIFKATVTLPSGGKASGYGSETAGDFGDFIEKAETKAIGRALNALGYGSQFAEPGEENDAGPRGVGGPRPANRPAAPARLAAPAAARAQRAAPNTSDLAAPADVQGSREASAQPPATSQPIDIAAGRQRGHRSGAPDGQGNDAATVESDVGDEGGRGRARTARPAPPASALATAAPSPEVGPPNVAPARDGEPDLAEYSWSAFWPWARGLGLKDKRSVEQLVGRATDGLNPAELRDLIVAAREEA